MGEFAGRGAGGVERVASIDRVERAGWVQFQNGAVFIMDHPGAVNLFADFQNADCTDRIDRPKHLTCHWTENFAPLR